MADRSVGGFGGLTAAATLTIVDTDDGTLAGAADLGRNYAGIIITCEDCEFIDPATTMTLLVGMTATDTLCDLHESDSAGTVWTSLALPAAAASTFHALIPDAAFCQRIQIMLSNVANGGSVVFKVWGFDPAIPV